MQTAHRCTASLVLLFLAALAISPAKLHAQPGSAVSADTPRSWADAAAHCEVQVINDSAFPVLFRERKLSAKGDTTRVIIESAQGSVARLIERNGQPLTAAEDQAERGRLNGLLASPQDFLKHHRRDAEQRDYAIGLVRLLPSAMLYTYAPGQPQPAGATSQQIVLDFTPDPHFKPPTLVSQLLTGLAGRVWIDPRTRCMTRIEGRVLHTINVGWGLIARIYPGGSIEFEQSPVVEGHWQYSHLDEHLQIREVLVHTAQQDAKITAFDFQPLPAPISFQDAIRKLLALPVPTQ